MNYSVSRPFLSPRAIQNARTRIFVPGSDPRFSFTSRTTSRPGMKDSAALRTPSLPVDRLFSPGLLDRLQAPLSRYSE
jgi:hypothetical protein